MLNLKWRRSAWLVALAGAAMLAVVAGRRSYARDDSGDIVVGEYGSLTGSEATFGVSTDDGIKLAVKQQNEKGGIHGRKIKLICYDDQGKQQEVINAVTRLIEQDHAAAILGEVASSRSIAGGEICQRAGIPMITPSSTNAKVTLIGNMISRVCFIDSFQGWAGARFSRENLKANTAAILYNRAQAYSAGLRDDFRRAFVKMGGKVVSEQAYADGDTDFSAQLLAIQQAAPDVLYIPGYYTDVIYIAKQARKIGLTCTLVGGDGWDSDELKSAGSALDGSYYTTHYAVEEQRPEVQQFVKAYHDEFGSNPDALAATGYDSAELLFNAMERAGSLEGKDLAAAINSTKDLHLVTGSVTIDANRNAKKPCVVLKLKDGVPSYYATINPPD